QPHAPTTTALRGGHLPAGAGRQRADRDGHRHRTGPLSCQSPTRPLPERPNGSPAYPNRPAQLPMAPPSPPTTPPAPQLPQRPRPPGSQHKEAAGPAEVTPLEAPPEGASPRVTAARPAADPPTYSKTPTAASAAARSSS